MHLQEFDTAAVLPPKPDLSAFVGIPNTFTGLGGTLYISADHCNKGFYHHFLHNEEVHNIMGELSSQSNVS